MGNIDKIQLPNGNTYDINDTYKSGIYTVIGTQTEATASWTGALHGVSALYTGLTINYYLPYAGVSSTDVTLNLTLDDGTTTGAKNCYINTSRLTTHYGAGRTIVMTYYSAGSISISGTATTDDRWICDAYYDTDANDISTIRPTYGRPTAGVNGLKRNSLFARTPDGKYTSFTTNAGTGTKTFDTTSYFDIRKIFYFASSSTLEVNSLITANTMSFSGNRVNMRYSFTGVTTSSSTSVLTANYPVYLVADPTSENNGCYRLKSPYYTQSPNDTSAIYILLGYMEDSYQLAFWIDNPIFSYDGTNLNPYVGATYAASAGKLSNTTKIGDVNQPVYFTANGVPSTINYTIATSVPSDAVFTDQKVTQTAVTDNSNYEILLSGTGDNITRIEGVNKSVNLIYNPDLETLTCPKVCTDDLYTLGGSFTTYKEVGEAYTHVTDVHSNGITIYNGNTVCTQLNSSGNIEAISLNGVTIGSNPVFTDTTYESKTASSGGTDVSLCTTGEKYTWNNKSDLTIGTTSTTALAGNTLYAGASTAGGAATSANKINTDAGSMLNPVYFSNGIPVASSGNSIPFIEGTGSTAGTWLGTLTGLTEYYDGLLILYKPSVAGASTTKLNLNNLGAKTCYINNTTKLTTHFPKNQPILLVYSSSQNSGCWMCLDDYWTNSNTVPSAYCETAEDTAAKTASCTSYTAKSNSYIHVLIRYANTKESALTLNINSQGAKPIYINGTASSSSNYTLPAGTYIVFYDGTNYYFRTDDKIHANITGDAGTVNGYTLGQNVSSSAKLTDQYVNQAANADANVAYQLLFEDTANSGNIVSGTRKTSYLAYNPSTSTLTVGDSLPAGGTVSVTNLSITNINGYALPAVPKFSDQAVQQLEGGNNVNYELLMEDAAGSGEVTSGSRKSNGLTFNPSTGKLTVSGQVDCSGISVSTPTYTMTKSSGAWNVGSVTARKSGNIVQMQVFVKGTGTSVANAGSGFVGKITGTYLPAIPTTLVSYISSVIIVCYIDTSGNIEIRPYGNTYTAASGTTIEVDGTFICS